MRRIPSDRGGVEPWRTPEDTPKAQHFLLSPECRTLTVLYLAKMRDTTAYDWFKRLRWPETESEPYCPKCGTLLYHTMSRNRFNCTEKTCNAVFSVTSGTVFHARKLSFKKMLIAIWFSANSVKGKAALQLSREIGVQYKTDDGTNTNQVESFFSRVQRAYVGIHHRFSLKYFDWYMAELAWREDCRPVSNRGHTVQMLGKALSRPTSLYVCGYWQGNKPPDLIWGG